jgi:uncharacterized protein with HEPN domain
MRKRDFGDYIQDIQDSIDDIESFTKDMNFRQFSKDKKTINAIVRCIEIVGEAAKKIPKRLRTEYPDIPWKKMAGMRDKMIHEYFGIDLEILWKVTKDEMPALKKSIKNMLDNMNKKVI